jgi:molybdopterin molybdotransferase
VLRGGAETGCVKTIGEALRETMALFAPLPSEAPFERGRFVAEPLIATRELPPFDASLVDGYAVRSSDVSAGVVLPVVGESAAGLNGPSPLAASTTMRIFTGAPIPAGADAVVMQEVVERAGASARFTRTVERGASIRPRASDIAIGDVLLDRGAEMDAGAIGLAATQGYLGSRALETHRQPRIAIVTTGDELLPGLLPITPPDVKFDEPFTPLVPPRNAIFDSNGPMLWALIAEAGARTKWSEHAPDRLDELRAKIALGLASADVVLTVGGVSVGDHDLVHAALAELGVERTLWKVRMKPGKPLAVGVKDGVPILGLPGNPVSAWVGFEVFVRPGLRRMLGDPRPYRRVVEVVLGAPVRCSPDRTELARARLDEEGIAWPAARQGSSALSSATSIDALLVLPERDGELAPGDGVRALVLAGRGSSTPPFV